ncbi:MAG TPA: TonB-dependent receptor, partial [Acidobacteriaceae bacterium]|nr:TonB-dependent receptor [Acidobacteriaceae bacterium]
LSSQAGEKVSVRVTAAGFADESTVVGVPAGAPDFTVRLRLRPAGELTQLTVTANRIPLAADASASSTVDLSQQQLQNTPVLTLDDKLRQVPGFELFRRSSSLVANPTTQGISLRGLGSTAASRTLLINDLVPINDPFGGWIHWNEIPALAVDRVEIARGGGSDLYGSSAIGGVVNLVTERPQAAPQRFGFNGGYGGENTPFGDGLWTGSAHKFSALVAASILRTDGYILVAPSQRGPVDIPSNVHYQSGRVELVQALAPTATVFVRGNVYNEARSNGTRLQTNATRLWRYAAGADFSPGAAGAFAVRFYGTDEGYRQSFSSISPGRITERLTRLQRTPAQEFGLAAQWSRSLGPHWTLLAGADTRDVRGTDREVPIVQGAAAGVSDTSARQRETGGYGEALFESGPWSVALSARGDRFSNLDTVRTIVDSKGGKIITSIPNRSENVGDPRLGVVRRLGANVALSASAFRAFRSATLNELYRTGQVGQEITLPNADLMSERATGAEGGVLFQLPVHNTALRASYFFTEVNRPITALTLSVTPTQIIKQRENLGQLQSQGVSLDFDSRPVNWLMLTGGYQYAHATVTQFKPQPALVGNWLPQVPRNTATAKLMLNKNAWGTFVFSARTSGRQFDDDQNLFLLHSFFRFDIYAEHDFGHHVQVYGMFDNITNRVIEVGRTPSLTLAQPRVAAIGVRVFGGGG